MEKIWLKSYPPGIPADINPDSYHSLIEILEESFAEHHNHPAFYNMGSTISFSQLGEYSRDFAAYLQQELGLKKGDRIGIMLPNLLQYPIVLFAALRAGLIVVNINPLYTADELVRQINDAGVETLVVVENFAHVVEKAFPQVKLKNVIITRVGDMLSPLKKIVVNVGLKYIAKKIPAWNIPRVKWFLTALKSGKKLPFNKVAINNQDTAFLQYTGGTTGVAKGAILTHRNIIANILQADAWFKGLLVDKQEIIITALPLYHIFSLTANCLYFYKMGGLNVLITNPRDIPSMLKDMRRFKFTGLTAVNTLFNALMKHPKFANLDFSDLHLALGGGMAVQKVVADKWQQITKAPLLEAYGLTETSPCVSINPITALGYNGTIGLPVSSTEVAILDDEGNEKPLGEPGELAVKGPQVMQGYWNNPTETAKVFTKDGWLLTGDIATMDEKGYLRILERKKEMILVSGFNVYPNEIEDVIARMPGVREVAVIAVPDEKSGEVPKAFVVKEDPNITDKDVVSFCHQHLTGYKVPKYVEFATDLPKSNVGKILRRALREHKNNQ